MKQSLGMLIGVPLAGSVVGATGGAIAWKAHRVWGGVIGFFVGGALGGAAGALLAKNQIEKKVLPEFERIAEESGVSLEAEVSQAASEGTKNLLNSGDTGVGLQTFIPQQLIQSAVANTMGMTSASPLVKAVSAAVASVQKASMPSQIRLGSKVVSGAVAANPPTVGLQTTTGTLLSTKPTMVTSPAVPRLSLVQSAAKPTVVAAAPTTSLIASLLKTSTPPPASTVDLSTQKTFVPAGGTMSWLS